MDFTIAVVIIGVVLIVFLFIILFVMPTENKEIKQKKKSKAEPKEIVQKDLKPVIEKLEHHIGTLHQQIANFEKKENDYQKRLLLEEAKIKKFQEKLAQEREWHEKEQGTTDRRGKELKAISDELKKVQESYSKEHADNLKLQNDIKELKKSLEEEMHQRRQAESNDQQLKATVERYRQDIAELRAVNIELKKKKEDTTFVAKSDFERVEKLLKEKEKELEKLRSEIKGL